MPNETAASGSGGQTECGRPMTLQAVAGWAGLALTLGNIVFLAINWMNFSRQEKQWAIQRASLMPTFEFHYYAMPSDGPTINMLSVSKLQEGHPLFQSTPVTDSDGKQFLVDAFGSRSFVDEDTKAIDPASAKQILDQKMEMEGRFWVLQFELARGYAVKNVRLRFSRYLSSGANTLKDVYAFVPETEGSLAKEFEGKNVEVPVGDMSVGNAFYIPLSLEFGGSDPSNPENYVQFVFGHFGIPNTLIFNDPVTNEDVEVEIRKMLDATFVTWVDVLGRG